MKIVHLCLGAFFPDNYSYQENMLPKFHKKLGYEVEVIASQETFDKNGQITYTDFSGVYYNEYDIKVTRLKYSFPRTLNHKLKHYKNVFEALSDANPNIIFVHNLQFMSIFSIIKYVRANQSVKLYIDNHVDSFNSAKNCFSRHFIHGIMWKLCATVVNPFTKKFYGVLPARVEWLINVYGLPKEKCELLVIGVDDDEVSRIKNSDIRMTIRNTYSISDNEVLLLAGGKIDNNKKEIITLMRAFAKSNISNVKLMIFGSINKSLTHEFEAAISPNIIYVGWLNPTQIYDYMEASDIIVFPGLHSVLWEQAVGMGKACIFRKIDGFDHVDLDGNCIFFDSIDIDHIMNPIIQCIEDNTWKEMQCIAEQKGMNYFSYEKIAKRCIEELEEN